MGQTCKNTFMVNNINVCDLGLSFVCPKGLKMLNCTFPLSWQTSALTGLTETWYTWLNITTHIEGFNTL